MKVTVEQNFEVPIEELWSHIGDFGDMSRWTGLPAETCVQEGSGIGSIRTLTLQDGGKILDRLDAETESSYSYSIINPAECPLPFVSYSATMQVESTGAKSSKLIWSGEIEPDGLSESETRAFAENMYGGGIKMMLRSLAKKSA